MHFPLCGDIKHETSNIDFYVKSTTWKKTKSKNQATSKHQKKWLNFQLLLHLHGRLLHGVSDFTGISNEISSVKFFEG